ncbi:MAG: CBS domain-containing protein [Gammaproteobacteria bacterium]|nr:MAG: CBS domain-containing protein [Gammaproteobacteria bacterium]
MSMAFHSLQHSTLNGKVRYAHPTQNLPDHVTAQSAALDVMTDLRRTTAVTTTAHQTIDRALQEMINIGVRMLLVEDHEGLVIGLITATDIQGDKPMRFVKESGHKHDDVEVKDIMTSLNQVEAIRLAEVERSHVGDIVTTLTQSGRQHALVIDESQEEGSTIVVGIFSTTQISRQMGIAISPSEKPQTFTELESAIAG